MCLNCCLESGKFTPLSSIISQVYVQNNRVGLASYHFLGQDEGDKDEIELPHAYISYKNAPAIWTLDDNTPPPAKKYFIEGKYMRSTRTFTGQILWQPVTFSSDSKWEYV